MKNILTKTILRILIVKTYLFYMTIGLPAQSAGYAASGEPRETQDAFDNFIFAKVKKDDIKTYETGISLSEIQGEVMKLSPKTFQQYNSTIL